jgi:hypothetical protein
MLQDVSFSDYRYDLFIKRVVVQKSVWGLQSDEGWATSYSNENEDIDVLPFWSDEAYANACAKDNWKEYIAASIPLAEFLENWCIGIAKDNKLIGVNWDTNMFGNEVRALDLAFEILKMLKIENVSIPFFEYKDVDDFIEILNHSLN